MVNDAVKRNLARHVDEYRASAGRSRSLEQQQLARHAERIELCKVRTRAHVQQLRDDGMSDAQIMAASKALRRLMGAVLPLATVQIDCAERFTGVGTSFAVPVYDDE